MSKNAITVIDQELIDWFENWLSDTEVNELLEIDEKTIELLDMAKDLIEINAELTKCNMRTRIHLSDLVSSCEINTGHEPSLSCYQRSLGMAKKLLKGE